MNNILSVNPGAWVKGTVTANVSNARPVVTKAGKTIFKCTLRDGQDVVEATSFSKTFEHIDGKRVQFSGMGIRRGDDHGGKTCVVIGDKVVFKTIEESSPSQTPPEAPEPRKSEGKAVSGPARVEGVTVGMALNKAVDLAIAAGDLSNEAIWHRASVLIRLSTRLQAGDLAPEATAEEANNEAPF